MKMNEIKGLETKELAEKLETAVANYDQLKLNHAVTPLENPCMWTSHIPTERKPLQMCRCA